MKYLSNKELAKITKGTLALVIAGTLTFSTTNAFANEKDETVEKTYQTVDLPHSVTNTSKQEVNETETPSLIPGSFFYFAKIAFEKMHLAVTFDKEKEAKILAEYAAERFAEADVLFKNGKEDEATELIKKAIEHISNIENIASNDKDSTEESTKTENPKVENGKIDVVTKEEGATDEVNQLLSQNIIALKAALEKVKNPVAKAALQKNIEKSYAKLARKSLNLRKNMN
ncbi:hypothetical protein KDN24_21210 [Bacillus sp. Bva_UNVM-123]|uniref:DUF5667 domain-containing protein n=1 Tax=Bacillus sp. Bva_UNVM-123 TaxID=2829798 RepID=UPI00391FC724